MNSTSLNTSNCYHMEFVNNLNIETVEPIAFHQYNTVALDALETQNSLTRGGISRISTVTANWENELSELVEIFVKYGNNSEGVPALHYAIMRGDEKAVTILLDHGASPNSKASKHLVYFNGSLTPNTVLDYAAKYGHLGIVNLLLSRGADVLEIQQDGIFYTPLGFAAESNNSDIIKALSEKGSLLNLVYENNPIFTAIQSGSLKALQTLLALGAKFDNYSSGHLISMAIRSGNVELVKYLIDRGILIDPPGQEGAVISLAFSAAIEIENVEMVKLLTTYNVKVSIPNSSQNDPWHIALRKNNPEILKILSKSTQPDLNDALFYATSSGHLNSAKFLIENGANVNAINKTNREPVIFTALRHPEILKLLIEKGVDINPIFDGGNTPLHKAVYTSSDSVLILLKAGAKINAKNTDGKTPLWLVSIDGSTQSYADIIKILLDNGADPKIVCDTSHSIFQLAMANRKLSLDLIKKFIKCGALVNDKPDYQRSVLGESIARNYPIETIRFLVNEAGANINTKDKSGGTPFLLAVQLGNFEAMKFLKEKGGNINIKDNGGTSALSYAKKHRLELVDWLVANGATL